MMKVKFASFLALLVFFGMITAFAQTRITGKVIDEATGEALPFVSVVVKSTSTVFITSDEGIFTFEVPSPESVLRFSYVGYETLEVVVDVKRTMTVRLTPSQTALEAAVVTGIFNKPRESYTGAANRISAEELKIAGNRSVLSTIRNLDPSFYIAENINVGSDPNKLPSITIRGASSLPTDIRDLQASAENMRMANQPLVVLNGFEITLTRFMDIDENMIESITLLKDANATAMYGSRGSNGVIVVTTKVPKEGRLQLTYKGGINIEAPDLTSYNLMNAQEKLRYEWAAGLYDASNAIQDQELKDLYNRRKIDTERGVDTYWLKYPVRVGVGNRHSINVEGGENTVRYGLNLSYNNITGAMKGSSRNTLNGGMLFMYKVKNLTFQNDLQINHNKGSNSPYGTFYQYGTINSYWNPFDEDGNIRKLLEEVVYHGIQSITSNRVYNPLWNAIQPSRNTNEYTGITNNFSMEWNITPYLFFRSKFGVRATTNRSDNYISANNTMFDSFTGDDYVRKGRYTYGTGNNNRYEGMVTLNYSKILQEDHQIFAGIGTTISQESGESYAVVGEGISLLTMDFLGAAKQYLKDGRPAGSESIMRSAGYLMNATYTYKQRYFADISGKVEGSSQFGSNKKIAPFWSTGIGWNLHHESFLKGNPVLNLARLRLSYGITGSQAFASYLANSSYNDFGGLSYQNEYGVYLMALGNPDLAWQTANHWDLGMEMHLFKNRLRLNMDLYNKLTKGVLSDVNLPTAGGFESYKANIGDVLNKGVELSAMIFVLRNSGGVTWSVGTTLAHNVNTIMKISNSLEAMNNELMNLNNNDSRSVNPSFLYKEGQSINTIYAVPSRGIDPGTGREIYVKADGTETFTWDAKDQVPFGKTDPTVWGTFNTILRYKGVNLGAYFSYRYGEQIYNHVLANKIENIYPYNNADRRALSDRWQNAGDYALFKSVKDFSTTRATSRFIMENNVFTLQSMSLGYDIPAAICNKILGMQYLSVTGYLEDIFYLSSIKREMGLDYPFTRKFSISLTARF